MGTDLGTLAFLPKPISTVAVRPAGVQVQISQAIVQRTAALRAYNSFASGRDWIEKLSSAYVVALATRSADESVMQKLQTCICEDPPISCKKCRELTLGTAAIRARAFPQLAALRAHANKLIHHMDEPNHRGIAGLNVEAVFDYCHHLFQENADLLFGIVSDVPLPLVRCKKCKTQAVGKVGN